MASLADNPDFKLAEMGPKMQACSELERAFAWHYVLNNQQGPQAARDAGYSDPGPESAAIRVRSHELLHRQRVVDAIEELGRKVFRNLLIPAVNATRDLIENKKHPDHAKAVLSVLSRLGFSERSGVDVTVTGEVTVSHTDEAVLQLQTLKDLGVPRDKLVDIFGFSGLARYEGMLAERAQRGALKVIEHEPS